MAIPSTCTHEHRPLAAVPHDHDHNHDHGHHHPHVAPDASHRPRQRRALWLCVLLTAAMMVVEAVAGHLTGSLMLVSDALHMLSHAGSLGVSLLAIVLAARAAGARYSFGLYRVEILAALLNGVTLAGFSAWIVWESILRLMHPVPVLGAEMTAVALAGLVVNLVTAFLLARAGVEDINTRSAFLHMLADTLSSVAIVLGGAVLWLTGWVAIDPILSLLVAALVGRWSWGLLRESLPILLERRPEHLPPGEVECHLREHFPEVRDLHDVHVWEITSQFICLSGHVVVADMSLSETAGLRRRLQEFLHGHFGIAHTVLQIEC